MEKIKEYPEMLKYRRVRKVLEAEIAAGRFGGDEPLPREDVLAKTLGVGRVTLRRAMGELVEAGLIQRIKGKGTFVIPAAELRKTNLVGVTCGGSSSIICGATEVLAQHEYFPAAMSYPYDGVKSEAERIDEMAELGAAGFLIRPACEMRGEYRDNSELFEKISKGGRPVVTVDRILPEHKVSAVVCDHEAIERLMVEWLAERSVRNVAYIGSGDGYIAKRRHAAMLSSCVAENIELVSDKRIRWSGGYHPSAYAVDAMREIDGTSAEAVVCYSPQLAAGALYAIKSSPWIQNKRVKYVLTFCRPGDVDMLRKFASEGVEIVTVQGDPAELASEAAAMLLEHIENGSLAEPVVKKIQPMLHHLKDEKSKPPMDWHDY